MFRIFAFLAALVIGSTAALADKWYVTGGGGWSFANDTGFNDTIMRDFDGEGGFKPFEWNLGGHGDSGGMWEAGFGRSFMNVLGGTLSLGFAANGRYFDSESSFTYSDSVNIYEDANLGISANGGHWGDVNSLGFMFAATYRVDQVAQKVQGVSIAPLVEVQLGAARNEFESGLVSANITKSFKGESHSLNANCTADDRTNVDLAYAARAGIDAQFTEMISAQVLGGYFNQGVFKSPDQLSCSASFKGETVDFNQNIKEREGDLDGWDVLGRLTVSF